MAKNLTVGSPLRLIILFTLPLLVGNLFQQAYAVTDAIVVGRMLGVDALAAVGASGSLQFLLFGFAMGCSAGLSIPVARAFGAGELATMRRAVTTGAWVSLVVGLSITVIGTVGARALLALLGTPRELVGQSAAFLAVLFGGAVVTTAFNYLSAIIRALGDSRTPLYFLVLACVLNGVLVVAFIAGLHMGVGGAALATVLAQLVSVVLCLVLVWRRMPVLHLHADDWRIDPVQLRVSARQGLTMGFQMSIIAIGAGMLQFGINSLGTDAVAAFTAAMRIDAVAVIPLASAGVAMSTFVAQNAGARQWQRVLTGVRQAGLLAMGMALALSVVIYFAGTWMVAQFVGAGQQRVIDMAHRYLVINAVLYWMLSILFVLRNAIQSLGSTMAPTLAGVLELVARGAVGIFLVGHFGFLAVILAAPFAWVLALIPLVAAWLVHRRRMIGLVRHGDHPLVGEDAPVR